MIYLLLSILCSAMISIIMRISTDKVSGNISMLAMNYLMCLIIGVAYTGIDNLFPQEPELLQTLGLGGINGVLFLLSFVLFQRSVEKNGVVLSSIFMKLGLLVPMVVSIGLFGEMPTLLQGVGFCIAIVAILLINLEKEKSEVHFKIDLLVLLVAAGSGDAMSKIFEETGNVMLSSQFLLYTFGMAFLLCLGLMLWKKQILGKAEILYGLMIGIPNYFGAKFLLRSLEDIAAVIAYPTYSVSTILVVTLVGVVMFKERLEKRQWVAVGIILVALILLNT